METPIPLVDRPIYERSVAAAWAEGRAMAPEQVLAAWGAVTTPTTTPTEPSPVPQARKAPIAPNGLTSRELEVLRLLAQGLTSAQIAERLEYFADQNDEPEYGAALEAVQQAALE